MGRTADTRRATGNRYGVAANTEAAEQTAEPSRPAMQPMAAPPAPPPQTVAPVVEAPPEPEVAAASPAPAAPQLAMRTRRVAREIAPAGGGDDGDLSRNERGPLGGFARPRPHATQHEGQTRARDLDALDGSERPSPDVAQNGVQEGRWYDDRTSDRGESGAVNRNAVQAAARVLSRCSDAAAVTLTERVPLWRERLEGAGGPAGAVRVWGDAKRACELPAWPDRVALLRLIVAQVTTVDGQLALYQGFRNEPGARAWVRDVLLRTLARTGELSRASSLGLARLDAETLTAALAHAASPQERLNVLRLLARRFPDDLELTLLVLDAAAAVNDAAEVRRTAGRLREDPRTDARVRTAVGEALLAIGDEAEARRTFSEIVEFAPDDPWARRRLGDIALAHGWADEAYRQFQTLATQLNDAPEILLRLAWAARAAGRFDEALRLAERVTTQTAPGAAGTVSEAAAAWISTELALAGTEPGVAPATLAALRARWRRSPAARSAGAVRVVLRWAHPDDEAELWVSNVGEAAHRADLVAALVPVETSVWAEAPDALQVEVRRGGGGRPRGSAEVIVIWNEGTARERVSRQRVTFDLEHPRFAFDARDGALTARPIATTTETAAAGRGRVQ